MKRTHAIDPDILIEQVVNTAPFLFEDSAQGSNSKTAPELFAPGVSLSPGNFTPAFSYVDILRAAKATPTQELDLHSYFELCLASHFATVGTFVPTDVDLAIRQKLWTGIHHEKSFLPFWQSVQTFHQWDERLVSKRVIWTQSGRKLSGHQGEWFSVAMGAYGCALKVAHEFIPEVREAIEEEFKNQEAALIELKNEWAEKPSAQSLKNFLGGVAAVAHNLGDLDRMFEAWEISETDVLKRRVFRAGHEDARHPKPIFLLAGKVYQAMLAHENHRHFALRDPKPLRISSRFLLPFGPFMDEWGVGLVKEGLEKELLSEGDLRDIVEALVLGWKKLNSNSIFTSQGYARALYGIACALGGISADGKISPPDVKLGFRRLENLVPPIIKKELTESGLRTLFQSSRSEFERKWMSRLRAELAPASE